MATPSSSSPPPLLLPPPDSFQPHPSPPQKKTQAIPWTHQETFNLIQAYQEKWYSLKKGQLKASQWEEVAITVAARCGFDEPSKSSTQCRHKIEKLRKRYRAERLKPYPNSWQYFELMDHMERGPLPIFAHPVAMVKCPNANPPDPQRYFYDNNVDNDCDDVDVSYVKSKSKSINHIVHGENGMMDEGFVVDRMGKDRNFMNEKRNVYFEDDDDEEDEYEFDVRNVNRMGKDQNFGVRMGKDSSFGGRMAKDLNFGVRMAKDRNFMRNSMNGKRKAYFENMGVNDYEDDVEEEEDDEEESVGGSELAAEIRGFAERFMRMENKKMEMMKETQRYRMEMEKRRMEMILETQRNLIETITSVVGPNKKVKIAQEF